MKPLATISIFSLVSLFLVNNVFAADSATVTATITAQSVSVSVSDGTVTYGTLTTGTSEDTTSGGLNNTQTASNDGNITEDINIRGQDSVNWTLSATSGADQYVHEFCKVDTGDCDGTPTWAALTTSNQTLKLSLVSSGTYDFDLKITTPSTSTNFTQQSVDVVIQASAS